jgi:hypothetical protein
MVVPGKGQESAVQVRLKYWRDWEILSPAAILTNYVGREFTLVNIYRLKQFEREGYWSSSGILPA